MTSEMQNAPIVEGDVATDFTLPADEGEVTLSALRGEGVILYFYPKDSTAGCTLEARDFTAKADDFAKLGYRILGVSRDSVASHCRFKAKQELTITLLSDKEETVCRAYGVMKEKMMYGKKCFGIERSTFVINPEGVVVKAMRGVKAKGHVEALLAELS